MSAGPLFAGLVYDQEDRRVETAYVGQEPCYVVDDAGFKRHIPSAEVDRQILSFLGAQIEGHEEILSDQAAKLSGQDDIFSRAVFLEQFKNIESQFDQIIEEGLPEEGRTYMGMTGFKVIIDHHGDLVDVEQPGLIADED